jgi:spermidine synthase
VKRDPRLLLALAVTGLAALALEVIWSRALIPWVGGTAWSQIATVAVYMGGLFLGSAVAVRVLPRVADPRRAFVQTEVAAAVAGLCAVLALPLVDPLLRLFSRGSLLGSEIGSLLRGLAGGGLMFPATILMGLSFPLAIAAIQAGLDERGRGGGRGERSAAALAYGVNTLGATAGALCGGFLLVPLLGVTWGAAAAVVFDLAVLAFAWPAPKFEVTAALPVAAKGREARPRGARGAAQPSIPAPSAPAPASQAPLLVSIAIGGVVALGLEAVLFRVLGLLLGPTARAFTVVLAVYVLGLGVGSLLVRPLVARGRRRAEAIYFSCWVVIGVVGLLVHWRTGALSEIVARGYVEWKGELGSDLLSRLAWKLGRRALIAGLVLLPLTCAFGASYSAAVAAGASGDARHAGRLYAALTLGNIAGLGLAALVLLPHFGLDLGLLVVLAVAFVTPLPALLQSGLARSTKVALAAALVAGGAISLFAMPSWPIRLFHTAPYIYSSTSDSGQQATRVVVYQHTGFETVVTVLKIGEDLFLQLDGKTTGSTKVEDQATQTLLGILPAALHADPKRALVIGLGTGQSPAEVLRFPVERCDCAEISPEVAGAMDDFTAINRGCRTDPRFRLLVADGRTVLRYGGERYDLVISEPSNLWIPGVAHLFTKESFEDARRCLDPKQGICCQWMQSYGLETPVLRAVVRTFLEVFPGATLWFSSLSYPDIFLIGSVAPLQIDVAALEQRLAAAKIVNPSDPPRLLTADGLLRCFIAGPETLRRFSEGAPLTRDAKPMLEYAAEASLLTGSASPTLKTISTLCEPAVPWLVNAPAGFVEKLERRAAVNRALNRIIIEGDTGSSELHEESFGQMRLLTSAHPDDRELRHAVAAIFAEAARDGFSRRGDAPVLRQLLKDALELSPDQPAVLSVAAELDAADGRVDEALHKLDAAAHSTASWRVSPRFEGASLLLRVGRPRDAMAICWELLDRDPSLAIAWELLARSCESTGDLAGARSAWEHLLRLDPESAAARKALDPASRRGAP